MDDSPLGTGMFGLTHAKDACDHLKRGAFSMYEHGCYISQLEQSSTSCELCRTLFTGLSTVLGDSLRRDYEVQFKLKSQPNIAPRLTYWIHGDYSSQQRFELSPVTKKTKFPKPLCHIEPFEDIQPDPFSKAAILRIQDWITNCETAHPYCPDSITSTLPKRVVDVESLKLYESQGEAAKFVALSHVWGSGKRFMTDKQTIQTRYQGLLWEDLPKTFQDAVVLTRSLGVQYLWIDSLCIIQDDELDWEAESAEMAHIYKASYLTIAASLANGDDEGFSRERTEHLTSVATVTLDDDTEEQFKIRPLPKKHYRRDVGPRNRNWRNNMTVPGDPPQPLETRAWCFQERLVSRRILSFCDLEMEWDCASCSRCECETRLLVHDECFDRVLQGIEPVPGKSSMRSLYQSLLCLVEAIGTEVSENVSYMQNIIRQHWRELLIPSYSLLKLTKPRDRLHALTAVASELSEILQDDYLAGHWRKDLNLGIAWKAGVFGLNDPCPGWQPLEYRAPSWSWASIEGSITSADDSGHLNTVATPCVDIVEANCTKTAHNRFGSVVAGFLRVSGTAVEASLTASALEPYGDEGKIEYKVSTPGGWVLSSTFLPDTPLSQAQVQNELVACRANSKSGEARSPIKAQILCLAILEHRKRPQLGPIDSNEDEVQPGTVDFVTTLVLGRSTSIPNSFQRLGIATVSWKEFSNEMSKMNVMIV